MDTSSVPGTLTKIYGLKGGAELTTADGLIKAAYEHGQDQSNGSYDTVTASLNVGFQPELILTLNNPFTLPPSVFTGPQRNIRRLLTGKVIRDWNLPAQIISSKYAVTATEKAHFVVTINGPFFPGWGTGTYVQNSPTSGLYTVTFDLGGPWWFSVRNPGSYTIRLAGDTTGIIFPLPVTITPTPSGPGIGIAVREVSTNPVDWNVPETTSMTSPLDVIKNIPPDGSSGGTANVPNVLRSAALPVGPGTQGTIVISAPGVPSLTILIQSTN